MSIERLGNGRYGTGYFGAGRYGVYTNRTFEAGASAQETASTEAQVRALFSVFSEAIENGSTSASITLESNVSAYSFSFGIADQRGTNVLLNAVGSGDTYSFAFGDFQFIRSVNALATVLSSGEGDISLVWGQPITADKPAWSRLDNPENTWVPVDEGQTPVWRS